MASGLLLECFAFLALYNRRTATLFGLSAILFHYFNDLIMGLYFYDNEKVVWIFFVNIPFWMALLLRRFLKKKQPPVETSPHVIPT